MATAFECSASSSGMERRASVEMHAGLPERADPLPYVRSRRR